MALPPFANETWYALRLGASVDDATVIVDLSRGVVLAVGQGGLKGAFRDACNKPLIGKPRRPRVVQSATEAGRDELRGSMPGVAVEVAPVPEVVEHRARAHLRHQATDAGPGTWGYSREVFEDLLSLGDELLELEPWDFISDLETLTLRAPDHGIEEGALLLLGNARTEFGYLVFPTLELADEFRALSDGPRSELLAARMTGPHFAFSFDDSEVITPSMRKAAHRTGYAGPPYPLPLRFAADLQPAPATEAEARMLLEAGNVLAELAAEDEEKLARGLPALAEVDGVTLIYHGRNRDPAEVVAIHGGPVDQEAGDDEAAAWRADDFALLQRLTALADATFGSTWRAAAELPTDVEGSPVRGLVLWPTLLAEPLGASTALAELRLRHPDSFDARTEAILAAEAVAWTGLWEVLSVFTGEGFEARDLLTHETRFVHDIAASGSLHERTVLCARIPTIGEVSWIAAADAHGLGPYQADRVRTAVAEQQRWPKTRAVPIGKVLAARAQRELARQWRDAVDAAKSVPPPVLRSKDGEVLQIVEDGYLISRPDLRKVEGAERGLEIGPPWIVSTGDGPLAKSAVYLDGSGLRVESLSIEQADRTRARLEAAFGAALEPGRRHVRSISEEVAALPPKRGADLQVVPSEAEQEALQQYKANHYATWPDVPLPALAGKTPRQAATQKRTRVQLERLIDDMQHHEELSAPGTRYDFDILRRALGLAERNRSWD